MYLQSEQIESFNDNGFLILDNFFSKVELEDFKQALKKLIQIYLRKASKLYPEINPKDFIENELDEGLIKLESIDHTYIANIYDTIFQMPEFLRFPSKTETAECINQLFVRDPKSPLYIDTARCRIDIPFDEKKICGWHQEVFYYVPKSNFLQTWAPLIRDASKENGAIEVCVGSHKEGITKQSGLIHEDVHYKYIVDEEIVKKYTPVTMELKLGQLLIFNSKLIHRSGRNTSKNVRYSLVGINHNLDNEYFIPPKLIAKEQEKELRSFYDDVFKSET